MALRENLCTPLDVRNLSEYITTQVRSNSRIIQFIQKEDPIIISALRNTYPNGTADFLNSDGVWNGPPQELYPYTDETTGETVRNSGDIALSDINPTTSAVTELWTITFIDTSRYNVYGTVSGDKGSGNTKANFSCTQIDIPLANWSGAAVADDVLYVATYRFDPLVVALSAKLSTAVAIMSVFEGVSEEMAAEGRRMYTAAMDLLRRMQRPYADDGLRLGTFSTRDISPEGIEYKIDSYGIDISQYADNARTSYDDSSAGTYVDFIYGPSW